MNMEGWMKAEDESFLHVGDLSEHTFTVSKSARTGLWCINAFLCYNRLASKQIGKQTDKHVNG